jgi:hypothetical protein
MKIECNEGGAWMVIGTMIAAGVSAAFSIGLFSFNGVKAECYKAQSAAYAASAAQVPKCN